MSNDSTVGLVLAADNNFALPLAVAGRSLLDNLSDSGRFCWYVLDLGLSAWSRDLLARSWPEVGNLRFLTIDEERLAGLAPSRHSVGHFPTLVFGYLFVPAMLDGRHERLIYLDADLLVVRDVLPLLDLPLAGRAFGAAIDWQFAGNSAQSTARAYGVDTELNSGVLIIDSGMWRQQAITERVIEFARQHDDLLLPDQDALNVAARGLWLEIGYEWNWQVARTVMRDYRGPLPRILHFGGPRKPWLGRSARPHYLRLYRAYARRTAFDTSMFEEPAYPAFSEDEGG